MSSSSLSLSRGQEVLFLWNAGNQPNDIQEAVGNVKTLVEPDGSVQVEHIERLHLCMYHL